VGNLGRLLEAWEYIETTTYKYYETHFFKFNKRVSWVGNLGRLLEAWEYIT